jgi:hypothetical protein
MTSVTRGEVVVACGLTISIARVICALVPTVELYVIRFCSLRYVYRPNTIRFLAGISAIQGVFFIVYAVLITIGVLRFGLTGPEAVSNSAGVTLAVIIFLFFGIGLVITARGWWHIKSWARSPFILAQLLALVVGIPLMSAAGLGEKIVGLFVTIVAVTGGVVALLPATTTLLYRDEGQ